MDPLEISKGLENQIRAIGVCVIPRDCPLFGGIKDLKIVAQKRWCAERVYCVAVSQDGNSRRSGQCCKSLHGQCNF